MEKRNARVFRNQETTIKAKDAEYIRLKPIGYPLKSTDEEDTPSLTTDDPKLFEAFAKTEWLGESVSKGDYLFDTIMYPDYAFRVEDVKPNPGRITKRTKIYLISPYSSRQTFKVKTKRNISFKDIVGQKEAIEKCMIIAKFLKNRKLMNSEWAPRNILFYGPPGTGKTMTAIALANYVKANFLSIKASELLGVFVGEGAKRIHQLFKEARKKRPTIIFIDELDVIALNRSYQSIRGDVIEVVNALLSEMDGLEDNTGIIVIGATNAENVLDPAIKSRFEQMIKFSLPTYEERIQILKKYAKASPIPFSVKNWDIIAAKTSNWSGRELKEKIIKNAIHYAVLHNLQAIDDTLLQKILKMSKMESDSINFKHYA